MRLSCIRLVRGKQEAILQGMVHVGPKKLYRMLQANLDTASADGRTILYEGVQEEPDATPVTMNEVRIRKTFRMLLDLYPVFATALGLATQKECVRYPENSINADISFAELTRLLDENGFSCDLMFKLLSTASRDEVAPWIKEHGLSIYDQELGAFARFSSWLFMRKALPILRDHRNAVVVAKLEAVPTDKSIFVHYGDKHLPGIVQLMKQAGWSVASTTYIDLTILKETRKLKITTT